jgi:hypothetical protein
VDTNVLNACPGFWKNLFTIGISYARWVAAMNRELKQGGAGFWFAWLLVPWANFGLAKRLNGAHAAIGSTVSNSPFWAWFFTGWPFIGTRKRLARSANVLAVAVNAQRNAVAQGQQHPAPPAVAV